MELPRFKYHPDPLDSGSIVPSDTECVCCHQARGYVYDGPAYSEEEYERCICPWCIADGSASRTLGVEFHDDAAVPGSSFIDAPQVAPEVVAEVCTRTPGFSGWQQEEWFTCCDDAAAFLGRAGETELESRWPDAVPALKATSGLDGAQWAAFLQALDREGSPTAYVFQCLHCGRYGAYQDSD
jgi:uncharacterized protein CbrC (UPF0167 family)